MIQTLAPAGFSHHYQRLPELSGPERGQVWHRHDIYPELAPSREIADQAAALQRRTLILLSPGLTPSTPDRGAHQIHFRRKRPRPTHDVPSERPIQDAFSLFRAEEAETMPCAPAAQEV